jgi:glucose/arabinose dehydrogenase
MVFYNSKAIPEWENNLFVCGLSSQRLDRLVIVNDKVVGEEALLTDKNERFRDVVFYKDMLYTITDSGILFRISKQ